MGFLARTEDCVMYSKRFSVMPPPSPPQPNPPPSGAAFFLCPVVWFGVPSPAFAQWQQELYQRALQEAQAVVRPSILERDLLGVWN
jgi:hypothetical protein